MRLEFLNHEITRIHAAALLLGAAGFLSRLLGVLRDRLLASTFGAGRELDVYYAAFQIPDFMAVLFLLGAASSAILPIFQEHLSRDPQEARRLITEIILLFGAGAVILTAIAAILAPLLVPLIAPGFDETSRGLTVALTRVMLMSPILLGFSSIFSSVVQSFQRFFAYALAPILYNIGIIAGVIIFVPWWGVVGLAAGVVLGASLHFLINLTVARNLGFAGFSASSPSPWVSLSSLSFSPGIKRVVAVSFPRVLSVSLSNLTLLVLISIGSTLAAGSISVLNLAHNLYFMPIGIFGISYAIAIFPRLSRSYVKRETGEFFRELFLGLRTILFWLIPSAVIFVVLRAHIVRVALGAGEFSWEDTRLTAASLAILAPALAAGGTITLLIKSFYALENTWRPLAVNIAASIFTIGASLFTAKVWAQTQVFRDTVGSLLRVSDLPNLEVLGLAAGFAGGMILNALLLYALLRRFAERTLGERARFPARVVAKITFASLLGGTAAYAVRVSFSETLPLITFIQVFWQGAVSGLVGFVVYFIILYAFGNEEVHSLAATLRRKLFRVEALPTSWDGESRT